MCNVVTSPCFPTISGARNIQMGARCNWAKILVSSCLVNVLGVGDIKAIWSNWEEKKDGRQNAVAEETLLDKKIL